MKQNEKPEDPFEAGLKEVLSSGPPQGPKPVRKPQNLPQPSLHLSATPPQQRATIGGIIFRILAAAGALALLAYFGFQVAQR